MKKLLILAIAIATTTTVNAEGFISATAESSDGSGLDAPFVITSINPSKDTLSVRYTSPDGNRLGYLNIGTWDEGKEGTEETADGFLPFFKMSRPMWAYIIYNKYTNGITDRFNSGEEDIISLDDMENPLSGNKTNKIYYAARVGMTTNYISGKIDYSMCVTSSVYRDGVECRAEDNGDGTLRYWPYFDGERLEIPVLDKNDNEDEMVKVQIEPKKGVKVSKVTPKAPNTGVAK